MTGMAVEEPYDRKRRYIVLGLRADTEAWRRERGLSPRDVIQISTRNADAGRGMSGDFDVVKLPSWELASERVREAVDHNLAIIAATTRRR